jgi:DNA modification methylase
VAKELRRNSIGYEIDLELKPIILQKIGYSPYPLTDDVIEIGERGDALKLRKSLQEKVKKQRSVTSNNMKLTKGQ